MPRLPGEPAVWQLGPLLPLDQMPRMPAAAQAVWMSSRNGSVLGFRVPQELLTMFGRLAGSASDPSTRVGASIHSAAAIRSTSEQVAQPLASIHRAPGATPI